MGLVIYTPTGHVALSIALGVLLLSVVLEPIVKKCFYRVRTDRAWRSIENSSEVDVTKYTFFAEMLGDRGKWDTARIVTLMLAAYQLATWGLELSVNLAMRTDGPVDVLNRPPPVVAGITESTENLTDWIVQAGQDPVQSEGSLGSFEGSLEDGYATASYRVGGSIVDGSTLFATWSRDFSEAPAGLFYHVGGGRTTVSTACANPSRTGSVYLDGGEKEMERWGVVVECESGPLILHNSSSASGSLPTILLNGTGGSTHLIVEETSSYPSFLYSVWKPENATTNEVDLRFVFFVSCTTRMAEAVVTAIANGIVSGGGCVDMLLQFSVANAMYDSSSGRRIAPFGEHPQSSHVDSLDEMEAIVAGVYLTDIGTACGFILIGVTAAGFVGCLCSLKRSPLNVYDRDALIRAVTLPRGQEGDADQASLKIFVSREGGNQRFRMVVSGDEVNRGCSSIRSKIVRESELLPEAAVPMRGISRTWSLPMMSISRVMSAYDSDEKSEDEPHENVPTNTHSRRGSNTVELVASPRPGLKRGASVLRGIAPRAHENSSLAVPKRDARAEVPTDVVAELPNAAGVENEEKSSRIEGGFGEGGGNGENKTPARLAASPAPSHAGSVSMLSDVTARARGSSPSAVVSRGAGTLLPGGLVAGSHHVVGVELDVRNEWSAGEGVGGGDVKTPVAVD